MNYKDKIEKILRPAFKDKIEEILRPAFKEGGEVPLIYTFKMVKLIEQAQRDAVKGFADRIKHEFMDCSAENAEDWSLVSMSYRQFTDFVDEYLNQTKEDIKEKQ